MPSDMCHLNNLYFYNNSKNEESSNYYKIDIHADVDAEVEDDISKDATENDGTWLEITGGEVSPDTATEEDGTSVEITGGDVE